MTVEIDSRSKGSYVLLVELPRSCRIQVGALGELEFPRGFYAYVGSAMGGLRGRLRRHLRRNKRLRWHIDYLLSEATLRALIFASMPERLECLLAQRLNRSFSSFAGFGAGDCSCQSHLFYSPRYTTLERAAEKIFTRLLVVSKPIVHRL